MYSKALAQAAALAGFFCDAVSAIATISAVGAKFFDSDGSQFYIKGTGLVFYVLPRSELTVKQEWHIN